MIPGRRAAALDMRTRLWRAVAAIIVALPTGALAIDVPAPGAASPARIALDVSADVGSHRSGSLDLDVTYAPLGGIHDSGLRLRLSWGASWYEYVASEDPREVANGDGNEGSLLVGYGMALERLSLIGLIGPTRNRSVDEGVVRTTNGTRVVVSAYARPGERGMAWASVTHSTIRSTTRIQAKLGTILPTGAFIGPELNLTWRRGAPWNADSSLARLGVHVSSIAVGPWFLGFSGGYARDHDLGSGGYLGLSLYGEF